MRCLRDLLVPRLNHGVGPSDMALRSRENAALFERHSPLAAPPLAACTQGRTHELRAWCDFAPAAGFLPSPPTLMSSAAFYLRRRADVEAHQKGRHRVRWGQLLWAAILANRVTTLFSIP